MVTSLLDDLTFLCVENVCWTDGQKDRRKTNVHLVGFVVVVNLRNNVASPTLYIFQCSFVRSFIQCRIRSFVELSVEAIIGFCFVFVWYDNGQCLQIGLGFWYSGLLFLFKWGRQVSFKRFQSISVLFYVCSHQGDIRSIRDVSLSEDIPEKDSQFKALVTSDVFVIPVSLSSLSLRLYFSFDVGLV